jgi:hypothetical protein
MKIVGWNQDELTFDVRTESKEVDPRPYGGKLMGSGSRQAEYTFTAESVCPKEDHATTTMTMSKRIEWDLLGECLPTSRIIVR